jgi:parallel beta-helix repeat protein
MRRTAPIAVALLVLAVPASAGASTIHVHAGQSIQAAVDAAAPGDAIVVGPGTYRERGRRCRGLHAHRCAVLVRKDHIRLLARPTHGQPVILQARHGQDLGFTFVGGTGRSCLRNRRRYLRGAKLAGFRVRGFHQDGVLLYCVRRWRVTRVKASHNREYGIFPSHSRRGRVDHSFASGANDTGIYIGQSSRVRVDHNRAVRNVSGFELENSSRVRADHNVATGNTAGILSFALTGLDVKHNRRNRIDHNRIGRNNKRNTCVDPEDVVCQVPSGSGILLLAPDRNVIQGNRVGGNRSFGIGLTSYCIGLQLSPADCARIDIDPNPDGNRITGNRVRGNGGRPALPPAFAVFARDLAWDTTGSGNCWSGNLAGTSFPPALPRCP